MKLPAIIVALLGSTIATGAQAGRVAIEEKQAYTCGPWLYYNAPWNARALVFGKDYVDRIVLDSARCPAGTINWYWPLATATGVYAYDFISWGSYDGGAPATPVAPRQVGRIGQLGLHYGLSYLNAIGSYDILAETFLRTDPRNSESKAIEIGFLLHVPPELNAWLNKDVQLGIFTDAGGHAWKAVRHPGPTNTFPYVTFAPADGADRPSGTVDLLGGIRWLAARKLVKPTWWFSGLALGAEPIAGAGWLKVDTVDVTFR